MTLQRCLRRKSNIGQKRHAMAATPSTNVTPATLALHPLRLREWAKHFAKSGIFSRSAALELLRDGFRRGFVSRQQRDGWPQNVWAITPVGEPLEEQLEGTGVYHGYPIPENDPFRDVMLSRQALA